MLEAILFILEETIKGDKGKKKRIADIKLVFFCISSCTRLQ